MKKILFLLLLSVTMYGQVPADATPLENIQITNNIQDTISDRVSVSTSDGVLNWKYAKDLIIPAKAFLSTGLIKNGLISASPDDTKFNITAGIGIISNFDNPENPISTIVNFPAFTAVTPTYLLTGNITYVAINSTPAVVMQATPFTPEQRRSLIVLGAVIHSNLTNINVVNNISAPTNATTNQLHDFIEAVGALNLTGNKYTANGANLQLNKSAGLIFKLGSNFANDWKNPHELAQTAGTSLTFRYRTQNGTEGSDRINLDPALYDLNNVLTAVPNNKFTIQTVTMFQSGVTRIQYGQTVYDDLATAKNAVFTRNFVLEPNSKENGIIRAYIIMKNTTTSLQNVADADILEAQKFGGVASGGVALTLANIVTALGFTPENVANKQNSLAVDGTGIKYPTVDAVNAGISIASKYDWFTINATKREDYMLQREYNSNRAYTTLTSREQNLSQVGDTYGHGAIIKLHQASTKLYVVSIANTVDTGDSATSVNCFVRLQILQGNTSGIINMPILSTTTIAKNGDVVGGKTIISGAGVPNAYIIGDILHIIWSAQANDGIWYEMHNTVNCLTDVIGTPEICTMESGLMNSAKIAAHLGRSDNAQISMNGTLTEFGGYYYSAAVSNTFWKNGAILRTTDFVNWEFAKEPSFTGITPQSQWEISLGALGSFMYMAIRQIDLDPLSDVNPTILAKLDASLNVVDWIEVPSGTSRPEFYLKGTTELYLVFPTDNRQNSVLLLIDPILKNSRPVQDIPVWGNYVSIAQRAGSSLQFAVRTAGSTGLRVSSMNANNITSTTIMNTREYVSTLTSDAQTQINTKAPNLLTGYVSGAGTVSATDNVLQAIQKLNGNDGLKANIASPTFTGTPTAPTATAGTNTTQLATTAFVTDGLTNKIGGSGTVNFIPKFTATGTIGNSGISEVSGITTFSAGDVYIFGSSNRRFLIGDNSSVSNYGGFRFQSSDKSVSFGNGYLNNSLVRNVVVNTDGTILLNGTLTGNILIGRTTDDLTNRLQVEGSASFTNSSSNPTIKSSSISSGISFLSDKFGGASGNHFEAKSSSSTVFSVGLTGNITANTYTGGATLTGTPTAPTATAGTNTTQLATTAFVQANVGASAHWTKTGNDIRNNNTGEVEVKPNSKLSILNASNVEVSRMNNSGSFISAVNSQGFFGSDGASGMSFDGSTLNFKNFGTSTFAFNPIYTSSNIFGGSPTGIYNIIGFTNQLIAPTGGSVVTNMINFSPTINQTGGANGITRSIYVNPTLTSAFDYRAIEVTAGKTVLQETTVTTLKTAVYTVATLPTPTGTAYATVSDALAPTYMATVVGGGAVVTPVFYNGTNWVAH